jgi:CBS domain-containing protein
MKIEQWMSRPVVAIGLDADLNRAAQLMWEQNCGAVVVVDGDGKLAGIVTDRDTCMAAYTQGKPLSAIPVQVAMARDVIRCHSDESESEVMHRMAEHQVRRLPVVDDDDRPVGVISLTDLARAAAAAARRPDGATAPRQLTESLAAVTHSQFADRAAFANAAG